MACIIKGNDVIPSSGGITPANVSNVNITNGDNCIEIEFKAPENIEINGSIISENSAIAFAIEKDGIPQIERNSNGGVSIGFQSSSENEGIIFYSNGSYDILNTYGEVLSYGSLDGGTFKVRFICSSQGTYYIRFAVVNSDKICNNSTSAIYEYEYNIKIPTFAEATWEEINTFSSNGKAKEYWQVGDEKIVPINYRDYYGHTHDQITLQIWGFEYYKNSFETPIGICIGIKEIIDFETYPGSGYSPTIGPDYAESYIRELVTGEIYSALGSTITNYIKSVSITYNGNAASGSGAGGTLDYEYMIVPSSDEAGITGSNPLPIFADSNNRVKYYENISFAKEWWTRTMTVNVSYRYGAYYCVSGSGAIAISGHNASNGVVFCFNI